MRLPRIALATVLAVAAFPAAAHAAPHWSSPKQVVAPPADPATQNVGTPQALGGPKGEPLGFAGDGSGHPLFLSGTIAGGLTATPITTDSLGGARGAVGADGTLAAVWGSGGKGHLGLGQIGGAFSVVDLPGDGANALDTAVSPDGTTTVAWRTKTADGTYQLLVAQAAKGGGLGEPQVVDSGKAGISLVDAAAGANGTVAVAYTKIAPPYRTRVTVKPAGAAAFEAPQSVSSSARADTSPAVAVATDGTVVAAWANPEAGMVTFRRPGATAFETPVSLGSPAFAVDLEPTPQGGAALAFSAPGDVRAAIAPAGGAFPAPAVAGPAPGQIPPTPSITVDPAGTATVAYGDTDSGEVRAIVLGGTTTVVGYGKPGALTPVSIAAAGSGQAHALWADGDGGISSATYGDTAPASKGPGEKPAPADRRAPRLRLLSSKRLTITRKTTALKLRFSCDEPCAIGIESNLRTISKGKRLVAPIPTRDYRKVQSRPKGAQTVTLKLGSIALKDLRRALKAGRGAQVFLRVTAVDRAGNGVGLKTTISVRAKKPGR